MKKKECCQDHKVSPVTLSLLFMYAYTNACFFVYIYGGHLSFIYVGTELFSL
jgi:hypothetical protein